MANAFCPEQYCIVQVHVRRGPVAKSLSGVGNKRDLDSGFFLKSYEQVYQLGAIFQGM